MDEKLIPTKEQTMSNKIKESYEDGVCPDCQENIPHNVVNGTNCSNCGHIFYTSKRPIVKLNVSGYDMYVDIALLQNQIDGLLNDEELNEDIKTGIHTVLGDLLDIALVECPELSE